MNEAINHRAIEREKLLRMGYTEHDISYIQHIEADDLPRELLTRLALDNIHTRVNFKKMLEQEKAELCTAFEASRQVSAVFKALAEELRRELREISPYDARCRCYKCGEFAPDHYDGCDYVRLTKED